MSHDLEPPEPIALTQADRKAMTTELNRQKRASNMLVAQKKKLARMLEDAVKYADSKNLDAMAFYRNPLVSNEATGMMCATNDFLFDAIQTVMLQNREVAIRTIRTMMLTGMEKDMQAMGLNEELPAREAPKAVTVEDMGFFKWSFKKEKEDPQEDEGPEIELWLYRHRSAPVELQEVVDGSYVVIPPDGAEHVACKNLMEVAAVLESYRSEPAPMAVVK